MSKGDIIDMRGQKQSSIYQKTIKALFLSWEHSAPVTGHHSGRQASWIGTALYLHAGTELVILSKVQREVVCEWFVKRRDFLPDYFPSS